MFCRAAVAGADDDDALALAGLIDLKATIAAVLAHVGRLDVAAELAAVDFNFLAGAADNAALHFFRHRFAQLVQQDEGGLGGRSKSIHLDE